MVGPVQWSESNLQAASPASAEEIGAIRDSATRALGDADCHDTLRALLDRTGEFDRALWSTAAELGWLGIGIPEEKGGFGLDIAVQCVLAEVVGNQLGSIPYGVHCAATAALARDDGNHGALIETAVSGKAVLTAVAPSALRSDTLPALEDSRLIGRLPCVCGAAFADHIVLPVRGGGLALVAMDQPGVTRLPVNSIDNSRGYADVAFEGCEAQALGDAVAAGRMLDDLALLSAFEQVGIAQASLEITRDYALERMAFGQPIGAFQAVKHELAEFYTATQIARGAGDAVFGTPADGFAYAVACARLAAMRAADFCAQEAIQLHGGIGGTWEAAPHLYLRRARCISVDLGTQEFWRDRILSLAPASRRAGELDAGDDSAGAAYREKARAFLREHAPAFSGKARAGLTQEEDLELGRKWMALKSAHGFSCITSPRELGGGGGTDPEKVIFLQEEAKYTLPTVYFSISVNMPIPIMIARAREEQKQELMPKAIRGEEIWCQLFSEPAAGSDLAGLRMTARREGDNWVLNGQKLWTSWAQYSDWGIVVVRHDPTLPKHQGLTYFFVDMKARGVSVRPVRMMGPHHVNEVWFDDVVVPDSQRLGEVGEGFRVAIETLMIERYSVTDPWGYGPDPIRLVEEAGAVLGEGGDPDLRDAVASVFYEAQGLKAINKKAFSAIAEGQEPGPEGSIGKLVIMRARQRLARLAMDAAGPAALAHRPERKTYESFTESWLLVPLNRIAGGTDQILRNTIAEKILGLPQDHRPDKGVPFNEIPG